MMQNVVRIRGVYATALTRLFLENGIVVCDPSDQIRERFGEDQRFRFEQAPDAEVRDRDNLQGVVLEGRARTVRLMAELLRRNLFDMLQWERRPVEERILSVEVEFPAGAKHILDEMRAQVAPTVRNHHWLRTIDSDSVSAVEAELAGNPGAAEALARRIENDLLWSRYSQGTMLEIEHVKSTGRTIYLRPSQIHDFDPERGRLMLVRRGFKPGGRYDGLKRRIQEGDFSVSEVSLGQSCYRHIYYRREGRPIGAYYNVNTPVEFFPDRIRYVDLEVDVVRWPDGTASIIDREELEQSYRSGFMTRELRDTALRIATETLSTAQAEDLQPFDPGRLATGWVS